MLLARLSRIVGNRIWTSKVRRTELVRYKPWFISAIEASTLPSQWYLDGAVSKLEERKVFNSTWQMVGHTAQVSKPGDFLTGTLLKARFIVCRGEDGVLRAFHNVCRHHAAAVARGCGSTTSFQCPYHGWTYGLDGRLCKATRLKGIRNFKASDMGLVPIELDIWGPFVFLRIAADDSERHQGVVDWLGEGGRRVLEAGVADPLVHVASREYQLECNWKVFVDNYLDGGYHVPFAHKNLAANLDLDTYSSTLYERLSVQACAPPQGGASERVGAGRHPLYAFVYPNLMINRYGPWLDTNLVLPLAVNRCLVRFDYFLEPSRAGDQAFVDSSLAASHEVQLEDVELCRSVQGGLESPAYDTGRYAPAVEAPMFHFHQMLYRDVMHNSEEMI